MQGLRQFGMAVLIAMISLGLVVGGLSLAFSESYTQPIPTQTQQTPPTPLILLTPTVTADFPATPTTQPTSTNTPLPPPACNPPVGWVSAPVLNGDTLTTIAARYKSTPEQIGQANCLLTDALVPGSTLFVPPVPTNTVQPCGAPFGWVRYIVRPGDTLYRIASSYGITTSQLQQANCMGYSTFIRAGDALWVPNVPTRTPGVTLIPSYPSPTLFPTDPLTDTPLPYTETPQPTVAPSSTPVPPTEPATATLTPFP